MSPRMFRKFFGSSPLVARAVPFLVFLALTFGQGRWFADSQYWIYLLKTLVGAWLLYEMRSFVPELRLAVSWEALAVGVGVCIMWVGLDGFYPKLDELFVKLGLSKPSTAAIPGWNPPLHFGTGSALGWCFVSVRVLGSSLVVPALEEVFFRSFLYRYIAKPDFLTIPLNYFGWTSFLVTAVIFGFEHSQWLAGILCAFAYQGLVLRKNRLGDAIVAHGLTNFLLGLWVIYKSDWQFW